MANRIDHLLFWTGGVILPRLSQLALASLAPANLALANPAPARRDLGLETQLADLERRAARGELAPSEFCGLAASAGGAPGEAGFLMESMLARLEIQPGMIALLRDLAPRLQFGLVCDYWQSWLEAKIAGSELARLVGPADIHYTAAFRGADLFAPLVGEGIIRPGSTLWVDHDAPRAMNAIRRGIDAAIYVDARRLRRDLGLWGILKL